MRKNSEEIIKGVYLIGGAGMTTADDAAIYLIDFDGDLILIDSGAGRSSSQIIRNIEMLGLNPANISHLILTHCHIDHIGSAPFFKKQYGAKILIHELDAPAVEKGDSRKTAANWYGTTFPPTAVDRKLKGEYEILTFGGERGFFSARISTGRFTKISTPTSISGKNPCGNCWISTRIFSVRDISESLIPKNAPAPISKGITHPLLYRRVS